MGTLHHEVVRETGTTSEFSSLGVPQRAPLQAPLRATPALKCPELPESLTSDSGAIVGAVCVTSLS